MLQLPQSQTLLQGLSSNLEMFVAKILIKNDRKSYVHRGLWVFKGSENKPFIFTVVENIILSSCCGTETVRSRWSS